MGARDESLANVYANALLDLAFEKGVHGEVLAELRAFREVLRTMPEFDAFLGTPNVRQEAKKEVVQKVFGGQISDATLHFLLTVIGKRRQGHLASMVDAFEQGYHERMGELVVHVATAVGLQQKQRDTLTKLLKAKFAKEIILDERTDERLLGGLVLRVGDSRIDGSLSTRLATIGARLSATRFRSEEYYED